MQLTINSIVDQPKRYQCRHIFTDGHRCGSPCLRGEELCYYHHTTRKPVTGARRRRSRRIAFDLPLPEDRSAIQSSIGQVLQRIASNDIDSRRAGLLLYGLHRKPQPAPRSRPPNHARSRHRRRDPPRPHLRSPRSTLRGRTGQLPSQPRRRALRSTQTQRRGRSHRRNQDRHLRAEPMRPSTRSALYSPGHPRDRRPSHSKNPPVEVLQQIVISTEAAQSHRAAKRRTPRISLLHPRPVLSVPSFQPRSQ